MVGFLSMGFRVKSQSGRETATNVRTVHLADFEEIIVNANIDVQLLQNDSVYIGYIEGDPNLAAQISLAVTGKSLHIAARDPLTSYKNKVIVTITVSRLKKLQVNSNSTVVSLNNLNVNGFSFILNAACCKLKRQKEDHIVNSQFAKNK